MEWHARCSFARCGGGNKAPFLTWISKEICFNLQLCTCNDCASLFEQKDKSYDVIEQSLRERYEPLISADGENWRMLQPFDVVYKANQGEVTEVWLETRLYHFSMGAIGEVLRKYSRNKEYQEGAMPWRMRTFKNPDSVIFGNATKAS